MRRITHSTLFRRALHQQSTHTQISIAALVQNFKNCENAKRIQSYYDGISKIAVNHGLHTVTPLKASNKNEYKENFRLVSRVLFGPDNFSKWFGNQISNADLLICVNLHPFLDEHTMQIMDDFVLRLSQKV